MLRQTSRWGQSILLALVCLGATVFATAYFYRLDEVITVPGRLEPKKGGVEVKSPMAGQLEKVFVKSGDKVKRGDNLVQFDLKSARSEETNLTKQLALEEQSLEHQLEGSSQRIITAHRNIQLGEELLERLIPLQKKGAMSEVQILQQKNKLEGQRDELSQLQTNRRQVISSSQSRKQQLLGRLDQIMNQLRNELVKAPIEGTVFDVKPDNDKYVVQNAEAILKLVPEGKLSASVNVSNRDIGFIKRGQPVKIRVQSFPFTEYGEIEGEISQVAADALPPTQLINTYHFPVSISLSSSELKTREGIAVPLQSGMTITTNLKLRDRRLIELLSDLFTNRSESLKRLRQP